MELVNAGPHFTMEDLEPYIKIKLVDTLQCSIPGMVGPIKIFNRSKNEEVRTKQRFLVIKQGKRTLSVDFTRGEPMVIVKVKDKHILILKRSFDSQERQKSIPIVGS
jgi:hypothetical protein